MPSHERLGFNIWILGVHKHSPHGIHVPCYRQSRDSHCLSQLFDVGVHSYKNNGNSSSLWMENSICDNHQSTSGVSVLSQGTASWTRASAGHRGVVRNRHSGATPLPSALHMGGSAHDCIWKGLHCSCWRSALELARSSQRVSGRSKGYSLFHLVIDGSQTLLPEVLSHTS